MTVLPTVPEPEFGSPAAVPPPMPAPTPVPAPAPTATPQPNWWAVVALVLAVVVLVPYVGDAWRKASQSHVLCEFFCGAGCQGHAPAPGPVPPPAPSPVPVPPPTPTPAPVTPGVAAGQNYAKALASSYADAWNAAATSVEQGKTVADAQKQLQTQWQKDRAAAFSSLVVPTFAAVLPAGVEPGDPAHRAAVVQTWRDFAAGLKGVK